ncbi:kinase domain-containing protein [Teratosphaeria destructans]|uniref:Kinase domain-containing protein n=1 Tax=Teratosphaeria destructans TaxID=418781 RepID=A0A9W7W4W4_9PEZI|nr:kinase domain-containing protein [Teratosphaeria destructans]
MLQNPVVDFIEMADMKTLQPHETPHPKLRSSERRRQASKPMRTKSTGDALNPEFTSEPSSQNAGHGRHTSTATASHVVRHIPRVLRRLSQQPTSNTWSPEEVSPRSSSGVIPEDGHCHVTANDGTLSPPDTPIKVRSRASLDESEGPLEVMTYDFSKLDYELERARVIGEGLWSTVLLTDAKHTSPVLETSLPSPPVTPQQKEKPGPSSVFAVKTPARRDAKDVFRQEAKVLTYLMSRPGATQYLVSFHGLDLRNSALVFEAVIGGSLENLTGRLKQMTEVARHLQLRQVFPGLSEDLVSGLEFIHDAGVVQADIKPANILLDISEHYSHPRPVLRARFIDFSAAFRVDTDDTTKHAGGTWDFMAPEQLKIQKELNTPTTASDVWALGITLLTLIVGESPYTAACGDNLFMLREAIKSGDPLGFAKMAGSKVQKRLAACQDFLDCCRLALKKDREKRVTATAWKSWVERELLLSEGDGECGPR